MRATRFIAAVATTTFIVGVAAVAWARIPADSLDGVSAVGKNDNSCWKYKTSEHGFAHKINSERTHEGLHKLSLDPELSKVARKHTWEMAHRNELYHTPSRKLRERVTKWTILGENVGVGGTVDSLHDAFMNSPAHKANVLYRTFKHVGVGVFRKGGRMWVTVIFAAVKDPGTTLRMPRC